MSTYTLAPDFNTFAEEVLDILQVMGDGETLTATQQARVQKTYNYMMSTWQTQGMHLWTYTEGRLYLKKDQRIYDTSVASTSAKFARITNDPIDDTLGAAASSGAGTITVSDGTKWTNGDNIGILLDDDTLQWTTINGAPVGNVLTLTDNLTGDAASGRWVTGYNDTYKPISRIPNALGSCRRYNGSESREYPIDMMDRNTNNSLSDKYTSTGTPVQVYFQRGATMNSDGHTMEFWTAPDTAKWAMNFTYERQLLLIDTPSSDLLDAPRYWIEAIAWNCADRLKSKFGIREGTERSMEIKEKAQLFLSQALNYDASVTNIQVKVGR